MTNYAAKMALDSLIYDENTGAYRITIRNVRVWFKTASMGSGSDLVLYQGKDAELRASVIKQSPVTADAIQEQMDIVRRHGNGSEAASVLS